MAESRAELDQLCVNTIRMLAVDMVEAANSGHPGMPLGAAPMAYALWSRFLRHNPADPAWPARDRFILSAGHGSALLYALLHLSGYGLSLDEVKNFRQWGSLTAGHPEYGLCPGVEATTGPLGQGFAMGVGMAMAQRYLAGRYQRPGFPVMDHHVYAIVSDGDLMEGVASEAASLAGTLGLGRLIYLYDDNRISIEGGTELAFKEDPGRRFEAYGWQVLKVADGNDIQAIAAAVEEARADSERPSLIRVRTHIGFGSPKVDTAGVHGEPLGAEAMAETRKRLAWPAESFHIPPQVKEHMGKALTRGKDWQDDWRLLMAGYQAKFPQEAAEFQRVLAGELPRGWQDAAPVFQPKEGPLATRAASGKVLNALAQKLPELVGGSADLAPSTKTVIAGSGDMRGRGAECGRNVHFGVREHGMAAAVNGMALHGGVIPYGATFFVFADYCRPSLRLAALMKCHSIFVFTHDSLGVGEDGPTHQPVEQLASLRAMPGLTTIRPADANETSAAWQVALSRKTPTCLVLTRQKLPILDPRLYAGSQGVAKGAYVLDEGGGEPQLILLASGSEVHLALAAAQELGAGGVKTRVVSMPSWELFREQDQAYRDAVLPPQVKARLAIEAGASLGWERWVGDGGDIIGVDRFGASAPGGKVLAEYGLNQENVAARAKALLKG
ncbi:transketolase [Desulfocarbo indianensis]|nr:transketolase [Desulfocarbo indianensis]